ncbi:maltokinase N-terminal cap-like domain-containing protein [Streptomyces sp. H27-S2]|uniref:maltokinase N-terminal cap-like domain-containing protein n=1 Tax=Streptomyces antarcticus TaxID=2996458 RepID=UPI00226EE200|nr:1,4-alpha-glucan branching protein [Streptomyces sp. H27-S2]MCY0950735.1 1,4-alpha-glucan branching protein [Streptomyces sp. H27-S2]
MAVIHRTTMTPTKHELLAAWLPLRSWYQGTGGPAELTAAELSAAGGFRIDDPEGEVGIEFMAVTDGSGGTPVAYLVPLTYRGAPLAGAEAGLIGTSEHGVLGTRWIYDGAHDPVLVGQLLALLAGKTAAQAQRESNVPDPTVEARPEGPGVPADLTRRPGGAADTADATVLAVGPAGHPDAAPLTLSLTRVLRPGPAAGDGLLGQVLARWTAPDGAELRGAVAVLRDADGPARGDGGR